MTAEKRTPANVFRMVTACSLLTSGAAFGQAAVPTPEWLKELPTTYVKACYGWLKANYRIVHLTADQLTAALDRRLENKEMVLVANGLRQDDADWAIKWSSTANNQPDCINAPIHLIDVWNAEENVKREQREREEQSKADAQAKYWQAHANDPIRIDYAEYRQSVAGTSAKPRKPAGSVRKLTLSEYRDWEKRMQAKWTNAVIAAGSDASVMQMHTQCKADIAAQWRNSFGYNGTVLRADALGNNVVTLSFAIGAACATNLLRLSGIPVTDEVSRVGTKVQF